MTIQRTTTRLAAALALLLGAMAAEATPITVDFTVTSNSVSNPSYDTGVTGGGYFTFDDALMPTSGNEIATLTFTNGLLTNWQIGGTYSPATCGFLRYACTSSGGSAPDFDALGSGGLAFTDAQRAGLAYGPVQWSVRSTAVPEPTTIALFGLSFAGLAFVRRRRAT
jgi:PEP-CTERM motif